MAKSPTKPLACFPVVSLACFRLKSVSMTDMRCVFKLMHSVHMQTGNRKSSRHRWNWTVSIEKVCTSDRAGIYVYAEGRRDRDSERKRECEREANTHFCGIRILENRPLNRKTVDIDDYIIPGDIRWNIISWLYVKLMGGKSNKYDLILFALIRTAPCHSASPSPTDHHHCPCPVICAPN